MRRRAVMEVGDKGGNAKGGRRGEVRRDQDIGEETKGEMMRGAVMEVEDKGENVKGGRRGVEVRRDQGIGEENKGGIRRVEVIKVLDKLGRRGELRYSTLERVRKEMKGEEGPRTAAAGRD
ncbi:hypothetical protein Pcinc_032894 [Petrolisthes cinctipes]|uniref:Uncharacterized protein n=1 Tax=Petrolisthes cinctipes TaxID=88211 RepID=A0AAE1ETF0_PETCI|nr:hypothetical protein Pcinc_032894 [Petrolisthes cinctipes]